MIGEVLGSATVDGLAAAAGLSTAMGGVFLALGRRGPSSSERSHPGIERMVRADARQKEGLPKKKTLWRRPKK